MSGTSVPIKGSRFANCESFLDFHESIFENIKNREQFFLLLPYKIWPTYNLANQLTKFNWKAGYFMKGDNVTVKKIIKPFFVLF